MGFITGDSGMRIVFGVSGVPGSVPESAYVMLPDGIH